MKKVVFLGPSLPLNEAQAICADAIFLPPAKCGDVLEVLKIEPSHILLIDGFFEATPAVWHKEILFVMTKGIEVSGASSMGALRAAELHSFGMHKIGQVAEWYSDGTITRDDEVAVLHLNAEHQYHGLTEPLVNVRSTLSLNDRAFHTLQELNYRERFWREKVPAVNQKALDAEQALETFDSEAEGGVAFKNLSSTLYFQGLHQQVFCRAPTLPFDALNDEQRLLTEARLFAPCYRELGRLAKLLYAGDRLQIKIDPKAHIAIKVLPTNIRWPDLNYPEWLAAILAQQLPYKAYFYAYFQQKKFMPSMTELKRKLTAWQKEVKAETPEAVLIWLKENEYSQAEFEQALVFETLIDYMIDRGNLFLSIASQDLPSIDFFAQAFHLSLGQEYLADVSSTLRENNIQFLQQHHQDVGLLNALDYYRFDDLLKFLTSCG